MTDFTSGLENSHVHLDDILVARHLEEQFSAHSRAHFDYLSEHGARTKAPKCELGKLSVTFLDHIIPSSRIAPSPDKAAAIRDYPQPHSYRQVRVSVGLVNFCRRFISICTEIVARPADLLREVRRKFELPAAEKQGFISVKGAIIKIALIIHPDP